MLSFNLHVAWIRNLPLFLINIHTNGGWGYFRFQYFMKMLTMYYVKKKLLPEELKQRLSSDVYLRLILKSERIKGHMFSNSLKRFTQIQAETDSNTFR